MDLFHRLPPIPRVYLCAFALAVTASLPTHADLLDTDPPSARFSDLSSPGGARAADDFRPLGDTISSVCAWGVYIKKDGEGILRDCAGEVTDKFHITVYYQDSFGLPAWAFGSSTVSPANVERSHQLPTRYEDRYDIYVFAYNLILDTPITGLDASGNTTYWLEIENTTDSPPDNACDWAWFKTETHYNNYSLAGDENGYNTASPRTRDFAFCVDTAFESPAPVVRVCCPCDGTCSETTIADCPNVPEDWIVTAVSCATAACPSRSNDDCSTVMDPGYPATNDGTHLFDNSCATTDGPNPNPNGWMPIMISNDLWYRYESPCDGWAVVSTCGTPYPENGGLYTAIAAYRDPNDRTQCVCPSQGTPAAWLWPDGLANNDGCAIPEDYNALRTGEIRAGDCLMVRVGSDVSPPYDRGRGYLHAFCSPLSPLYPWDNRCYGGSNNAGVCGINADCPGGTCGTKNRYLSFRLDYYEFSDHGYQITIVNAPSAPSLNGQVRWLKAQQTYTDGPGSPAFQAATLQCDPLYREYWGSEDQIHAYGPEIQPGSTYEVRMCRASDGLCSPPLTLTTAKWGDIITPFGAGQPNFQDISALVAKFQDKPTAINRPRAQLRGILVDPSKKISFLDISDDVSAFSGKPFPYASATTCP